MSRKIMVVAVLCLIGLLALSPVAKASSELIFLLSSQPQPKSGAASWSPVDAKVASWAWNSQMSAFMGDGAVSTTVARDADWHAVYSAALNAGLNLNEDGTLSVREEDAKSSLGINLFVAMLLAMAVAGVYYGVRSRIQERTLPETS